MDLTIAQAEQLILNKVYTNPDYTSLFAEYFDERLFDNKSIAITIKLILAYYKRYLSIPKPSVVNCLITKYCKEQDLNDKQIMTEFKNTLELSGFEEEFAKENTLELLKSKAMYYAIMDSLDDIQKKQDPSAVIEKFQQINNISFNDDMGFDYFDQQDEHWEQILNPKAKLPTGFNNIDKLTYGGFPKEGKCLCIFMAQPHMGKSMMLSNLAVNYMKQNLFPLVITLEMSEFMYGQRVDAHIANQDINQLHLVSDKAKDQILNFKNLYDDSKLVIKEFATSTANCTHLYSYINKLIAMGRKPHVLLVDYLNLLVPNDSSKNMGLYEKVGEIGKQLRALSYIFNIPAISATQTNRGGWNTSEVDIEHTSESAGIPAVADFLMTLWQQEGDRESGLLNGTILKNRFGGQVGRQVRFAIDYHTLLLSDLTTDEIDQEQPSLVDEASNDFDGFNELDELE